MYSYYLSSIFRLFLGFQNPLLLINIFLNAKDSGVKTVRLRASNLQFRVRGAMDVWSIKETFLDRFYERYGFTIQPRWNILDIGAGIGEFTLYAAVMGPGSQVFSFEPYPQSFVLMQENLRLNRVPNAQAFEKAIGATSGELVSALGASGPFGAGVWISMDVTAYVTGNGTYNLALTTPGSTAVSLASRQSGANAPQLIVETAP